MAFKGRKAVSSYFSNFSLEFNSCYDSEKLGIFFVFFFLSFGSVMKQKNKVGSPQLLTVKIGLVKIESPTN